MADSGGLDGSFPPMRSPPPLDRTSSEFQLASSTPLTKAYLSGSDDADEERSLIKHELSSTLNFSGLQRDLVKIDDTGIYALIAQMGKKLQDFEKVLSEPPWFAKVMASVSRIDGVEAQLQKLSDDVKHIVTKLHDVEVKQMKCEEQLAALPATAGSGGAAASEGGVDGQSSSSSSSSSSSAAALSPSSSSSSLPVPSPAAIASENGESAATPALVSDVPASELTLKHSQLIEDLQAQLAAARKEMKQRDDNNRLETSEKFSELAMQNTRLHQRLGAEFPGIEEFRQFQGVSAERHKKLKLTMTQKAADTQRLVDERFTEEFDKVMKWKETFATTTLDRMRSVEDLVRSFNEDLTYLKGGVDEHVHLLEERIQENQQWCQKKFGESGAEMKKMMTKSHEIAAKQREHSDALEKDTKRMNDMQVEINANKEAGFAHFMTLQLAIEQIHDVDAQQDINHEKLAEEVLQLESKIEGHDAKIEEHDKLFGEHGDQILELKVVDKRLAVDINTLREDELHDTNKSLRMLMESSEEQFTEIKEKTLPRMQQFAEVTKNDLSAMNSTVTKFPEQIEELTLEIATVKKDVTGSISASKGAEQVTTTILKRLTDVEETASAVQFLKDKSLSLHTEIERVEKECNTQITELSKNTSVIDKVKEDTMRLEERTKVNIANTAKNLQKDFDHRITEVKTIIKEVEDKTEAVVLQVVEAAARNGKGGGGKGGNSPDGRHHGARGGGGGGGGGFGGGDDQPRRTSVIGMSPLMVKEYESDVAEKIAEMGIEFEELCVQKTFVCELTGELRQMMADTCQEMAGFISSKADQEAIEKMIRGSPEDVLYTDEEIDEKRQTLLSSWMRKVAAKLNESSSNPGVTRAEAREKFIRKFSDAVDMSLSKYDQVLITGHSRVGRVQLPSCIACDRPLTNKKRVKDMEKKGSLKPSSFVEPAPQPGLARMEPMSGRPETANAAMFRQDDFDQQRPGTSNGGFVPGASGGARPQADLGGEKRPIFGSQNSKFVYRGGFKMPKSTVDSAAIIAMQGSMALPFLPGSSVTSNF